MIQNRDANMEFLYQDYTQIPIRALHLIEATLDGLQPTIDLPPEEVDQVKNSLIGIVKHISNEVESDFLISNEALAKKFIQEAHVTNNIVLASELRSLAILIGDSL